MTAVAVELDVDLSLESGDGPECIVCPGREAVMEGVLDGLPCGCPQYLCLACYGRNRPRWQPGDMCWCYVCRPHGEDDGAEFVRWERVRS